MPRTGRDQHIRRAWTRLGLLRPLKPLGDERIFLFSNMPRSPPWRQQKLTRYSSFLAFKSSRLGNLSLSLYNGGGRRPMARTRIAAISDWPQSSGWFTSASNISRIICAMLAGCPSHSGS